MMTSTGGLTYRRLRAPQASGEALIEPALNEFEATWSNNRDRLNSLPAELQNLRGPAQRQLVESAVAYSASYGVSHSKDFLNRARNGILLSGHQPHLFHPGVWFKNFLLSSLSQGVGGLGINLVVDNDICQSTSIKVPLRAGTGYSTRLLEFDAPSIPIPYEIRNVLDADLWNGFPRRLSEAIEPFGWKPIIAELGSEIAAVSESLSSIGTRLAAARHRLEERVGLKTLEVPISHVFGTSEFAQFLALILSRLTEFAVAYNEALFDYRRLHGIRSANHPVPALESSDGWTEIPLWVYSREQPTRRRVFARVAGPQIELTDRESWHLVESVSQFPEQCAALNAKGIMLRPRALMTTLYGRLILSDAFIHGIGGAKYDQLTDEIIRRVWKIDPPQFVTATMTSRLPFPFDSNLNSKIENCVRDLRDCKFHPERWGIQSRESGVQRLLESKRMLLQTQPPRGNRRVWHLELASVNESLSKVIAEQQSEFRTRLGALKDLAAAQQISGSREYSFAIFGVDLIESLKVASVFDN